MAAKKEWKIVPLAHGSTEYKRGYRLALKRRGETWQVFKRMPEAKNALKRAIGAMSHPKTPKRGRVALVKPDKDDFYFKHTKKVSFIAIEGSSMRENIATLRERIE